MSDLSHRTAAGAGVVLPHAAPAAAVTVQVPAERLLQDWKQAYARALAYVAAHGIPAGDHAQLAAEAVDRALHSAVWEPDGDAIAETLRAVRQHLAENHEEFRRIASNRTARRLLGEVQGEQLSRVPKGFDAEHPAAGRHIGDAVAHEVAIVDHPMLSTPCCMPWC